MGWAGCRCLWREPEDAGASQDVFFLTVRTHGEEGGGDDHSKEYQSKNEVMQHKGSS